ncbi:hypothetical protein F5Y13DRAFT_171588, partial [Hypoxylon sp. FL1857]
MKIPRVQSGFIAYRTVVNYLRKRRQQRQEHIIVLTRTGDPIAVILGPRSSDTSTSRLSVDSLIQMAGQSNVSEDKSC